MKRTITLLCLSKNDSILYESIKLKKNQIFKLNDGKYSYFDNHNNKWYPLNLKLIKIKEPEAITKQMSNVILKLVLQAHKEVIGYAKKDKFNKEMFGFGPDYNQMKLGKEIELWVNDLVLMNKFDISNLCCWIPFKILSKHIWRQGNKRTALITCILLLNFFHMYLSYSKNLGYTKLGENRWYNIFVQNVCKMEKNKKDYYRIYNKFYSEILKGVFFDVFSIEKE